MLCVLCLIVLWGFSLVTSYSGVIDTNRYIIYTIVPVYRKNGEYSVYFSRPIYPKSGIWGQAIYHYTMAGINSEHEKEVLKLLQRVGGPAAVKEFNSLSCSGYTGLAREKVTVCSEPVHELNVDGKCGEQVAPLLMRKGFWKSYGADSYPERTKVALRVLGLHATSAATERNWCL